MTDQPQTSVPEPPPEPSPFSEEPISRSNAIAWIIVWLLLGGFQLWLISQVVGPGTAGTANSFWPTTLQTWAEVLWRVVTVLGIVAGGLFTYYKFFRGREFARRVEPKLSAGSVARRGGTIYLQAEASAKNIGLSKVGISYDHTYILVEVREYGAMDWVELPDLYFVFQAQQALESGETVGEPILIEIPYRDYLAIRLTLCFAASRDNQWWARSLVRLAEEADNV